jgi:hypothetical protein
MTENNPFDIFRENTPLADLPTDSIDEFLDRINQDLVAGAPERITDERLAKLVELYRQEAAAWETKQREKPERKTKAAGEKKQEIAFALGIKLKI